MPKAYKSNYSTFSLMTKKTDQEKETVFLGVIMDEHLNWKSEISHVANKVSKSTGIIRKSSFYLCTKSFL